MLTAAQKTAPKVKNVRFRQIDLSTPIDQPAASIDGVLCRWGYMLLEDPESALRETRRILKQERQARPRRVDRARRQPVERRADARAAPARARCRRRRAPGSSRGPTRT